MLRFATFATALALSTQGVLAGPYSGDCRGTEVLDVQGRVLGKCIALQDGPDGQTLIAVRAASEADLPIPRMILTLGDIPTTDGPITVTENLDTLRARFTR